MNLIFVSGRSGAFLMKIMPHSNAPKKLRSWNKLSRRDSHTDRRRARAERGDSDAYLNFVYIVNATCDIFIRYKLKYY